jgi:hypothetical protein
LPNAIIAAASATTPYDLVLIAGSAARPPTRASKCRGCNWPLASASPIALAKRRSSARIRDLHRPGHLPLHAGLYPATVSSLVNAPSALQAAGSSARHPRSSGTRPQYRPDQNPVDSGHRHLPENYRRGYFQSFNLSFERDLGAGFNLTTAFVATRAIRQTARPNINYGFPGGGTNGRVLAQKWGRTADVTVYTPFNTANYNGWQNQLRRQFAGGGMLGAVLHLSKSLSFADNNDSGLTWNIPAMWDRNRAPAGFDRTHNLQIYGVYVLPFEGVRSLPTPAWPATLSAPVRLTESSAGTPHSFQCRDAAERVWTRLATPTADQ